MILAPEKGLIPLCGIGVSKIALIIKTILDVD